MGRRQPGTAAFPLVIASEAKQSRETVRQTGLLRRYAPRNDGAVIASAAKQSSSITATHPPPRYRDDGIDHFAAANA